MTYRVRVSHIEVTQSIQNASNDPFEAADRPYGSPSSTGIPLIAGKTTYARVYFNNFELHQDISAIGKLLIFDDNGYVYTLDSLGAVYWQSKPSYSLMEQRHNWSFSLNFALPKDSIIKPGKKFFKLVHLREQNSNSKIDISNIDKQVEVNFLPEQKLACRALVFRYWDIGNNRYLQPSCQEVDSIRRFMERAFPVSKIEWSTNAVVANHDFLLLNQVQNQGIEQEEIATKMLSKLLQQLMIIRNQELNSGINEKTLYIAVFSDPNSRFGSAAVDSPEFPATHVVAACAADSTGKTAAHEIAHILGRHHPGIPDIKVHPHALGQHQIDKYAKREMGENGYLSPNRISEFESAEKIYLGIDADPSSSSPRVLKHGRYYDLMTYMEPQWLSAYTYREIYNRLKFISELSLSCDTKRCWTVICSYDFERKTGRILHIFPAKFSTPQKPQDIETTEELLVLQQLLHLLWLSKLGVFEKRWDYIYKILITYFGNDLDALKDVLAKKASSKNSYTVAQYNEMISEILRREDKEDIHRIFSEYDVPEKLYEPDIKLYTNYSSSSKTSKLTEADTNRMWEQADQVYYRRKGSIDRFSFGLFQASVHSKPGSEQPPNSITLLIDGVVVDKYADTISTEEAKKIADRIFKLTDKTYTTQHSRQTETASDRPKDTSHCEYQPSSNSLVYDVAKGNYFLNFHWSLSTVDFTGISIDNRLNVKITTTIQCRPNSTHLNTNSPQTEWETVFVTDELRSQVWISEIFFENEKFNKIATRRHQCTPRKLPRDISYIKEDKLNFRFIITVGFYEFTSGSYTASPQVVRPRRKSRFKPVSSGKTCFNLNRYDDQF